MPARPKSTTPSDKEAEYKQHREFILNELKPLLDINEKLGPMCTDPRSVIQLHISPQYADKLHH